MSLNPEFIKPLREYLNKSLSEFFKPELTAVDDFRSALQPVADELNQAQAPFKGLTKLEIREKYFVKSELPLDTINSPLTANQVLESSDLHKPVYTGINITPLPRVAPEAPDSLESPSILLDLGKMFPVAAGATVGAAVGAREGVEKAGWMAGEPLSRRQLMTVGAETAKGSVKGALFGGVGEIVIACANPSLEVTKQPRENTITIISSSGLDKLHEAQRKFEAERLATYERAFNAWARDRGVTFMESAIIRGKKTDGKQFEVDLIRGLQDGASVYFFEYEEKGGKVMIAPTLPFRQEDVPGGGIKIQILIPGINSFIIVFEDDLDPPGPDGSRRLIRSIFTNPVNPTESITTATDSFRRQALDAIGAPIDSDLFKPISQPITSTPTSTPTSPPPPTATVTQLPNKNTLPPPVTKEDVQKAIELVDKSTDKGKKLEAIMKNGGSILSYKIGGKEMFIISSPLKNYQGITLANGEAIAAVYNPQTKTLEMEDELDKYRRLLDNVDTLITGQSKDVLPPRDYVSYTWGYRNIKDASGEFISIKVLSPNAYKDDKLVFPVWPTPTPAPPRSTPRPQPTAGATPQVSTCESGAIDLASVPEGLKKTPLWQPEIADFVITSLFGQVEKIRQADVIIKNIDNQGRILSVVTKKVFLYRKDLETGKDIYTTIYEGGDKMEIPFCRAVLKAQDLKTRNFIDLSWENLHSDDIIRVYFDANDGRAIGVLAFR